MSQEVVDFIWSHPDFTYSVSVTHSRSTVSVPFTPPILTCSRALLRYQKLSSSRIVYVKNRDKTTHGIIVCLLQYYIYFIVTFGSYFGGLFYCLNLVTRSRRILTIYHTQYEVNN